MAHPFEVGKMYRNRNGEYLVQAIEGDYMKIRYVSGGTLETRASIQARIWENIQFEEQMVREEERQRLAKEERLAARRRAAQAKRAKAKPKFEGFQESDFEPKKRGIAWSTRDEMGRSLEQQLNQGLEGEFSHWIVPRKPGVEVAKKRYFDKDNRERNAVFFVTVNEEGVSYGLRVGKPNGKSLVRWPWSRFVKALSEEDKVRRALRAVIKAHELDMDIYGVETSYGLVGQFEVQTRGFLWRHETAEQEMTRKMNWNQLVEYLQGVAAKKRCDLFLRKRIPPEEALQAGAGVVEEMASLFESLLPLYDVSVGA
jgi:hypothetical protein